MNADDSYFNKLREIELSEKEESDGFIKFLEAIFPFTKGAEAPYSETLNYTPADAQDLVEQFYSKENSGWGFQKTVKKEYEDFNGKGPGTLYLSDDKGKANFHFYPAPPKEWIEKQNLINTRSEFAANFFIHTAPVTTPFAMKTVPTNVVLQNQYGTKIKGPLPGSKGGKTLLQQRRDNNYLRQYEKETRKIDWIKNNIKNQGKTTKSDIVNNVVNKSPIDVRAIIKIAKKNKISYKQAEAYLEMLRSGIRPDIDIKPGSSMTKQLEEGTTQGSGSVNKALARIQKIRKDREDSLRNAGIDPEEFKNILDKDDIPMYDLNQIVHPTTYDGVNTINTLLNKHGGFKGGRLNLKSYDLKGNLDKRIAATVFITPYGKGGNFQAIAKREKSVVYQIFGTDLERMGFAPVTEKMGTSPSVQAHHAKSPIKAIIPGFEGIVKESPKYHRFTKLFFDNMLALGDMPENIIGVLGHVAKNPDSPHSLSHLFTRYMMGEDGRLFWTQDKLDQIVVYDNQGNAIGTKNDDLREKFILEQIELLKDNLKVLENATEQYKILFEQGIQDPATVIEYFEDKLPNLDKEYIRAFAPKIIKKFIAEVKTEEATTVQAQPITITERNEIIDNIFRRENVKEWRLWPVPVRKARMKEITGTEALDYEDGYTFEKIEAFIDAGWLDDERLYELFNPPPESWQQLFPDR